MVLIIPEDFTSSVRDTSKYVQLEAYTKVETLSPIQASKKLSFVNLLGELIRKAIVISVATEQRVDPTLVTKPVIVESRVRLYEKLMNIEEFSTISQFTNLVVLLIAVIIGVNSVNAAQFVATEKVEKAFEMLLAQPTPRRNIVIAKIIGSTFASLLIGAVYFFGLSSMLSGIFPSSTVAEVLYSKLGTGGIYMSLLSIVLGLISSGALGVLIGSIVSDERIASTLAFPIMLVSMGAAFAFSYASLPINVYTGILAGMTLSPAPYIILEGFISGNTMLIAITLLTELLFTLVVIFLAMYVYERDIVVLGIKIKGLRVRERE
jgi:ABC-2 type transport system permease protein